MNKVILSSYSIFKMLGNIPASMQPEELEVKVENKKFSISGIGYHLDVEPENDFTVKVRSEKLKWLFGVLKNISDQPLTIKFDTWNIEIQNVVI